MTEEEKPSERLVAQRVRNRIMEELWARSNGNGDLSDFAGGPNEWFESFFDWFPYEGEAEWYPAMTSEEESAVRDVLQLMQRAISDPSIPKNPTFEEIANSGWPNRVAPVAKRALDVLLERGRFSEEEEENEPSTPIPWPFS
jgi:hypothetical protein